MPDYISLADLAQRVPFKVQIDLADDKNPGESPLTDVQENELRAAIAADTTPADARLQRIIVILNGVIADGEGKVNDYLSYRGNVPVASPSRVILTHSLTFAAWYLYGRRQNIPDDIQAMHDDAVAWGEEIVRQATAGEEGSVVTGSTQGPRFLGGKRRLTQDSLREW